MQVHSNNTRTVRVSIPDQVNSIQLPDDCRYLVVKNVGILNSIRFSFAGDGVNDYWTLAPGAQSPELVVKPGAVINTDGVGGSSQTECLLWG